MSMWMIGGGETFRGRATQLASDAPPTSSIGQLRAVDLPRMIAPRPLYMIFIKRTDDIAVSAFAMNSQIHIVARQPPIRPFAPVVDSQPKLIREFGRQVSEKGCGVRAGEGVVVVHVEWRRQAFQQKRQLFIDLRDVDIARKIVNLHALLKIQIS